MGISGCSNHATINKVSVKDRSKKTKKTLQSAILQREEDRGERGAVEEEVTMAVTAAVVLQRQSKVRDAEGILDTGEWRHVDNSATIAIKIETMKNNHTNKDNSSIFNMSRRLEASKTNIETTETEDNNKGHNKSGGVFKGTELKKQRTDSITKK